MLIVSWEITKCGSIFCCFDGNYDVFQLRFKIFSGEEWTEGLSKMRAKSLENMD